MNPWGVESEWDRAGPPIGKRGRGGWWVNSSARAQAAGRGVYLEGRLHFDGTFERVLLQLFVSRSGRLSFFYFGRMVALVRKSAFIFYFYNYFNAKSGSR